MLTQHKDANSTAYQSTPTTKGLQNAHITFKVARKNDATGSTTNMSL